MSLLVGVGGQTVAAGEGAIQRMLAALRHDVLLGNSEAMSTE